MESQLIDRHSPSARMLSLGTGLLRLLPAEIAHDLSLWLMQRDLLRWLPLPSLTPLLEGLDAHVPGIGDLAHPIGLAAGFDKNARAPLAFSRLGLSFLEIGTITPRPQQGNPKPRLFRLEDQLGLINRMGFNGDGAEHILARLKHCAWNHDTVPMGINLGKNKDTSPEAAIEDYSHGLETFAPYGRYFVINVSSPNTEGLRGLANAEFLKELAFRHQKVLNRIWVKLDPDMQKKSFQSLVESIAAAGFQGLILTNTHRVEGPEKGGMSGHPLATQANACLEWAYEVTKGGLPLIASGGILSGQDVFQRIARGASATQIYSSLVYRGPLAVALMLQELKMEMKLQGFRFLSDLKGSYYQT
ncbi:MAG: quinone-dependent dihydroorotate dehydrogenase [Proteobacteria bacterium]|nr:quinone-dependent dihydroorotate dehydrogenase [Pseudomonadota bacterium]